MGAVEGHRRDLFRYLVSDDHADHLAIMSCFADEPGAALTATQIAARVGAHGGSLPTDVVESRCRSLLRWGNLTSARRDARVGSVGAYVDATPLYRATPDALRVHRSASVAAAVDGIPEVTRESLPRIADALSRLAATAADGSVDDPHGLAAEVTDVFVHHRSFAADIADLHAHLGAADTPRDDGADDTDATAGEALAEYVDIVATDVGRYAPRIVTSLERLRPHLDALLGALPDPALPGGRDRAPGRVRADWDALGRWYRDDAGPRRLRAAAAAALARSRARTRVPESAAAGFSHRADLLRLAGWFAESSDDRAHRLFAAAFGTYPSRHLLSGPDEPDPRIGAGTSWWFADPVPVAVSLRTRGDRAPRGRTGRLPDPPAHIDALAAEDARLRLDAAAELYATPTLRGARLTAPAQDLLLTCLAALFARHRDPDTPMRIDDPELDLSVRAEPGADTVVHGPGGDLVVHGLTLRAASLTGSAT
ncbi:DUF2397 domain-containing protein [Rhodococcus yananensis]|uniref:DUF2397 domain-containing protein n=1 Tax=Rhodococcus yananensis TaxID=2879464 RepID=UPI001CF83912|nr:DUF2397 domain-containing protein [Rhodococcus yananensis]